MSLQNAKRVALLGVLLAAAVVLGWVEHMVPVSVALPGVKLGLGNLAVVFAMYALGRREGLLLSCGKVLLCSVLFSGFSGFLYSAAGALCSFAVMAVLLRSNKLSSAGVSAAGGGAHIAAQLCIAALLTGTPQLWRLSPLMVAVGVLTGLLNGVIAGRALSLVAADVQ